MHFSVGVGDSDMAGPGAQSPFAMIASLLAVLLSNATSLEVRAPGSAGTLGGTPSQDLAREVLEALCSWLRATLR